MDSIESIRSNRLPSTIGAQAECHHPLIYSCRGNFKIYERPASQAVSAGEAQSGEIARRSTEPHGT